MAAHRSTGKRSWRSTDTRSHWTNATGRPTVSGRQLSPLQLHTTRTRAKQTFVPADPTRQVGLFDRGPTVSDLPHLGHAKTHTQFDLLVRLLRTRGLAVTYVQNITDVDDKIIRRARELGIDAPDLARMYERAYLDDMRAQISRIIRSSLERLHVHASAPRAVLSGS
jgi:hypothetical protein